MIWQCPYCKTNDLLFQGTKKTICWNCRNYHDANQRIMADEKEISLAQQYWCWPYNWQESDSWKSDPYYLKCPASSANL